jgi:general secretion pathway protein M
VKSLQHREILAIVACAAVVCAVLGFVVVPMEDYRSSLDDQIEASTRRLAEVRKYGDAYAQARGSHADFSTTLGKRGQDFTLFAYLETAATRDGAKDRIEFMRPSSRPLNATYQEDQVEMRLAGITLDRLMAYLYHVETAPEAVRVKRLAIQTNQPKNIVIDSVDLIFEAYAPAPPAAQAGRAGQDKAAKK